MFRCVLCIALLLVPVLLSADEAVPPRLDQLPDDPAAIKALSEAGLYSTESKTLVLENQKRRKHVVQLSLRANDDMPPEVLKHLRGLPRCTHIGLTGKAIDDAALQYVARHSAIERLSLIHTSVTDDGLAALQRLKRLKHLALSHTKIGATGIENLRGLPLETLDLNGTAITDDAMKHMVAFPKLRELYIPNTEITDRGVAHLRGHTQLELLGMSATKASTKSFDALADCKALSILTISGDRDSLADLPKVKHLRSLKTLHLQEIPVRDDEVKAIAQLPNLERLFISNAELTEEGIRALGNCRNLKELSLPVKWQMFASQELRMKLPMLKILGAR